MAVKKEVKKREEYKEEEVSSTFDTPVAPVSVPTSKRRIKVFIGVGLTAIVIVGTGLNLFLHYEKNQTLKKNPVLASEAMQEAIVAKVGKLIELPTTEQPTIATVTDSTKLKGQAFFQHAQNGDVVLIYPKANEAILFDPTADRILELGPINNNQQVVAGAATKANAGQVPKADAAQISATPASVTVALYNGTTIDGLTRKVQAQLTQVMPNATVVDNTNANKQNYSKTIIVDLTHKNAATTQQLATLLKGTVGSMPSTETVPVNADILVILGKQN